MSRAGSRPFSIRTTSIAVISIEPPVVLAERREG
jgi:hypothetical protein